MKDDEKDNWFELSYFDSQFSGAAASLAIRDEMTLEIKEKLKQVLAINKAISKETKKKKPNVLFLKRKHYEINVLNTEITLLRYEMHDIPLFHPRDSICGLQSIEVLVGRKVVKKYFVCVEQDNKERIVKEVTLNWLQLALEPPIFEYFLRYKNEK